jgi:hypothetical protein
MNLLLRRDFTGDPVKQLAHFRIVLSIQAAETRIAFRKRSVGQSISQSDRIGASAGRFVQAPRADNGGPNLMSLRIGRS